MKQKLLPAGATVMALLSAHAEAWREVIESRAADTSPLAPEAPIECPRAMAPPLGLTFSGSIFRSRITARDYAAKAAGSLLIRSASCHR